MKDDFLICSFTKADSVSTDLGKGIVRVGTSRIRSGDEFRRNKLVKITAKPGKSVYAIVRGSKNLGKSQIALEYDQRIELGVDQLPSSKLPLTIEKAGFFGWFPYVVRHPDPTVRLMGLFTIYITAIFTILSFLTSFKWD